MTGIYSRVHPMTGIYSRVHHTRAIHGRVHHTQAIHGRVHLSLPGIQQGAPLTSGYTAGCTYKEAPESLKEEEKPLRRASQPPLGERGNPVAKRAHLP